MAILPALSVQKAHERGHPQSGAIKMPDWIIPLLGIAPWFVALSWTCTRPAPSVVSDAPVGG